MDPKSLPAFPVPGWKGDADFNGMILRDYFAAKAMAALALQETCWRYSSKDEDTATRCYEMADAMLKARQS